MKLVLGLLVGAAVVLAAEFVYLTHGMPVAARNAKALPLEHFLTSRAVHAAIASGGVPSAPIPADEANLRAGARIYRENCAMCHGGPGGERKWAPAAAMFPTPPKLLAPNEGVTDDPVGETHWKVKNGIRLTGMPGFEGALSDTALWQVSLLVAEANRLPDGVRAELR